jgi:hypothetical protein
MTQFLRLSLFIFCVFFGVNLFAQSNNFKLENTTTKLQHVEGKEMILLSPTSVVKQKNQQINHPKKPKKKQKNAKSTGVKSLKSKQAIIHEETNPK